jgi:acyl-CoA thioesterase-1
MSFMWPDAGARPKSAPRSYGKLRHKVQRLAGALAVAALTLGSLAEPAAAAERTIKLVALGDSLTAGYQLPGAAAFPVQLEQALKAKGLAV